MKVTHYILIVFVIFTFIRCNSGNNGNSSISSNVNDSAAVDSSLKMDYILVSPSEMFEYIFFGELDPDPSFVNSKLNTKKYITTSKMSTNLGVYTTDFIYLNQGSSKTNSLDYYKVILDLAPRINIYSGTDENFPERIQNNLTNQDSLNELSKLVYYHILEDLEQEGRQKTYALIAGGVIIESVYLAVMNVKNYEDFKPLTQKIFDQGEFLNNSYHFIALQKNDPDVSSLLSKLKELKDCFDKLLATKNDIQVNKSNKDHLIIEGGSENVIYASDFEKLKRVAIKVRNEIVSDK